MPFWVKKTFKISKAIVGGFLLVGPTACSSIGEQPAGAVDDAGGEDVPRTIFNAADVPIDGVGKEAVHLFDDGDLLFNLQLREPDGLGPLYVRTACGACHKEGARGPGLVQKMAVVGGDGFTAASDQSKLAFGHTIRLGLAAGATTPISAPADDATVKVSTRLGPPVLGRGFMEAVADAEILRVEAEQKTRADGIHGHVNRVVYASEANVDTTFFSYKKGDANLIGRFGVKARVATIDDFVADAYQGDMGITTPMRPVELPNPDGLTDDKKPGIDLEIDHVNRIAFYLRRIAIPRRVGLTDQGIALFASTKCSACHVPSMKTRVDYPIGQMANVDAAIYTDMLLHDMGPALADGMTDGAAGSSDFRTAPLIGVRFAKTFLHDGRVTDLTEAILAHGGEAKVAVDAFRALSPADRDALVAFVQAL